MSFGEKLRKLREDNSITQKQLADYLNVGRSTIAGYETKSKQPDFEKLIKLSLFFNVSIDYLLGNTDIETPYKESKNNESQEIDPETKKLLKEIETLSEESKKDLKKHIDLLKIRDSLESKDNETSSTLEKHA